MIRGFIIGIFVSFLSFSVTHASEITPSHVYQKTEVLRLTLQQQNLLDTHQYEEQLGNDLLRHPRHVMQQVRKCDMILSKVLQNRDIQPTPMPNLLSVREVRPADVQNGVEHLLKHAQKLGDVRIPDVPFVPGKVPDDVYNNLKRICQAIDVKIDSADVYRVVSAINDSLDKIVKARGHEFEVPYANYTDKTPIDIYKETWIFLEDLRQLAFNPDYAIPGGVIFTDKMPEDQMNFQNGISLMNDALAETNAMKYTLGVREEVIIPLYESGKTPSNVFSQIERAHNVVKILLEEEAKE